MNVIANDCFTVIVIVHLTNKELENLKLMSALRRTAVLWGQEPGEDFI